MLLSPSSASGGLAMLGTRPMTDAEQTNFECQIAGMRDEELWREGEEEYVRENLQFGWECDRQEWLDYAGFIKFISRHDPATLWNYSSGDCEHCTRRVRMLFADPEGAGAVQCQCWQRAAALKYAAAARRKIFAQVASDDPTVTVLDFRGGEHTYGPGAFSDHIHARRDTDKRCTHDARAMCASLKGNTHVRKLYLQDDLVIADFKLLGSVLLDTNIISVIVGNYQGGAYDKLCELCFQNARRLLMHNALALSELSYVYLRRPSAMKRLAAALVCNWGRSPALRKLSLRWLPGMVSEFGKTHTKLVRQLSRFPAVIRASGLLTIEMEGVTTQGKRWQIGNAANTHYFCADQAPRTFRMWWGPIDKACAENRAQIKVRRLQRLLLSTLYRSPHGAGSLVQSPLFLNLDLCEHVLSFLEGPDCLSFPRQWNGKFAWHERDEDVAQAVEQQRVRRREFRVYQNQAKRRKLQELVHGMVMSEAKVSHSTAAAALRKHGGNMFEALIDCGMVDKMKLSHIQVDEWHG
eukprot:COSAG01_NODE_4517_length_4960_cov_3.538984_1_plen_522_part_00